jgi:hypothetical protein
VSQELFRASAEHSPMTGLDEYLIHNYPQPVRVMWTTDPRAYERLWFTSQDEVGELLVMIGLGFYPNLGTVEAYAIVNHRGHHTTVRAHRSLGDDRTDMRVGPINFEIVEPFKEWRLTLDDNPYGISYDLRWFDTKRSMFHRIAPGHINHGRVGGETAGYETFGEQAGWVKVGEETFAIERDSYRGSRDHHWGVRDGVGGPGHFMGSRHGMSGQWVEFPEWSVWLNRILYNLGDPRPGAGTILARTHRLRFEPDTNLLQAGEVDLLLASGDTKTLSFRRLGQQVAYLRCGMYGGPNGGTPYGDIWQGMYVGEDIVSGETFDTNDPEVRARICGLDDMHAVFECGGETVTGLIEPYDTVCYDWAKAGIGGFSLLA